MVGGQAPPRFPASHKSQTQKCLEIPLDFPNKYFVWERGKGNESAKRFMSTRSALGSTLVNTMEAGTTLRDLTQVLGARTAGASIHHNQELWDQRN